MEGAGAAEAAIETSAEGLATGQAYYPPVKTLIDQLDDMLLVSDEEMRDAVVHAAGDGARRGGGVGGGGDGGGGQAARAAGGEEGGDRGERREHDARLAAASAARRIVTLRAGAATVDITPAGPVLMDGYGGRREPSQAVHDPLFARVLVLEHEGARAAIVACDLLGMHARSRERCGCSPRSGRALPQDALMVCATHDHAGPAGLRGGMFSRLDDALAGTLVQRIIGALEEAAGSLRPAALKVGAGDGRYDQPEPARSGWADRSGAAGAARRRRGGADRDA